MARLLSEGARRDQARDGGREQIRVGSRTEGVPSAGKGLQGPTGGARRAGRGRTCAAGAEEEPARGGRGGGTRPRSSCAPRPAGSSPPPRSPGCCPDALRREPGPSRRRSCRGAGAG